MKRLVLTPRLRDIARRVVWFEPAEQAIADPTRFVAYAMTYGTDDAMAVVREQLSDDELREALRRAPPGIFDARSWAYWNVKLGRYPVPPMPKRRLPETAP